MERLMRLAINIPPVVLRTPLHGVMSRDLVSISFRGRRSGKAYTATANYLREDGSLAVTTDGRWWRNLRGGAPVTVRRSGPVVLRRSATSAARSSSRQPSPAIVTSSGMTSPSPS